MNAVQPILKEQATKDSWYIDILMEKYPRYKRDPLAVLQEPVNCPKYSAKPNRHSWAYQELAKEIACIELRKR